MARHALYLLKVLDYTQAFQEILINTPLINAVIHTRKYNSTNTRPIVLLELLFGLMYLCLLQRPVVGCTTALSTVSKSDLGLRPRCSATHFHLSSLDFKRLVTSRLHCIVCFLVDV